MKSLFLKKKKVSIIKDYKRFKKKEEALLAKVPNCSACNNPTRIFFNRGSNLYIAESVNGDNYDDWLLVTYKLYKLRFKVDMLRKYNNDVIFNYFKDGYTPNQFCDRMARKNNYAEMDGSTANDYTMPFEDWFARAKTIVIARYGVELDELPEAIMAHYYRKKGFTANKFAQYIGDIHKFKEIAYT